MHPLPTSLIKPHIRRLSGSGDILDGLVIERCTEAAFTDYPASYRQPAQHLLVVPTSSQSSLEWRVERTLRRAMFLPGDLILNPSGCFTEPRWDRETRFTLVAIEPDWVTGITDELELPAVDLQQHFHFQNGPLHRCVQQLISCFESEQPPDRLRVESLQRLVVLRTIHSFRPAPAGPHRLCDRKLAVLKRFIDERLNQPIRLEQMAREVGYSPSRLLFLFRNATGMSPHQYLMRERLGEALRLLRETRLPISWIAQDCGFADQSHLTRLLKRHIGITPGQFRE